MKPALTFTVCCLLYCLIACTKEKKEELPPATQTGAGTLGFKINNRIYKLNAPYVSAAYQHLRPPFREGSYFSVSAHWSRQDWYLGIHRDSLKIESGGVYPLNNSVDTRGVTFAKFADRAEYFTAPDLQGELRISKLDSIKHIVSGTFWFDARDTAGNVVQVREGRFDVYYTE